ncbi:MAG: thioredoxin family protein [Acidimicrobiia bacterium]|nr:thioredoxin family protein [Acidimicrobiia bacterium]
MWQELREELHPKGLEVVTVALDVGGVEATKEFVDRANAQHPSLLDQTHLVDELFGVVNVPNGVWIDEDQMIVRPAEPAFPGRNPVMESFEKLDVSTLPPDIAEMMTEVKKIKTDPEAYKAALLDWVEHGAASPYVLEPDDVVARSHARTDDEARAAAHFELGQHLHRIGHHDAAIPHWREAHRLQPDNWTYKRQAWNFEDPIRQGHTDAYDGSWIEDVKKIGAENYYPAVDF